MLALALALAGSYPTISHSFGLGRGQWEAASWTASGSHRITAKQRLVALHLGRVVDPNLLLLLARLPVASALAGLCDSPVRATVPLRFVGARAELLLLGSLSRCEFIL